MRDVRRRERLAGLKRTARRDSSNQGAPAKSRTGKDSSPTEKTLVLRSASPSSSSLTSSSVEVQSKRRGSSTTRRDRSTKRAASHADSLQTTSGPRALPSSWSIAPFCTTPGTSKLTYKVAYLVHHCKFHAFTSQQSSGMKCSTILAHRLSTNTRSPTPQKSHLSWCQQVFLRRQWQREL